MNDHPFVSCVIPVRNEAATVGAAIRSCLDQCYDGSLEVVVADGMSDDGTRDVVTVLAAEDPRVRLVDNPGRVTPAALNSAMAAAKGEVIVRCDSHAVLPRDYVARAVAVLAATGAANVGGIQHAVGEGPVQRAVAMAMSSPLGVGDARFHYGGAAGPVDTVYLGAFRREALEGVGGFDERLERNQDYELNYRLRAAGETVWFDPALRVDYRARESLGALWRQYHGYGAGKRKVLRLHRRALRWRQLAPPLLVAGLTGSAVALVAGAPMLASVVPTAYGALLIAGTAVELVRRRDAAALLLPVTFATMHVAWGVGFLQPSTPKSLQP